MPRSSRRGQRGETGQQFHRGDNAADARPCQINECDASISQIKHIARMRVGMEINHQSGSFLVPASAPSDASWRRSRAGGIHRRQIVAGMPSMITLHVEKWSWSIASGFFWNNHTGLIRQILPKRSTLRASIARPAHASTTVQTHQPCWSADNAGFPETPAQPVWQVAAKFAGRPQFWRQCRATNFEG